MKNKFKLYGEFSKVEEQEDGTLKVSGIASSEAVDSDGEVITAEAMKAAIPDYMAFGALREMHTSWAAGTAIKCEVGEDNRTYFEALVVDAEACKKVQTGTYKGFSIGGRWTKRDPLNKSIITGVKLIEISLVDRPANPEAVFSMGKVEGDEPDATLGTLRKGLYTVGDFAYLLQSLAWMAQATECEADYEGDGSPIPAAFGQWVADGLALLQAMTAEEAAELLATLPAPPADVLAMAAKFTKRSKNWTPEQHETFIQLWDSVNCPDGIEKKGAKFSKSTAVALGEVHKALADCHEKLAALGFDKADNVEEDDTDESKKAAGIEVSINVTDIPEFREALAKAEGLAGDLAKATEAVTKLTSENETLTKRVVELEAQPQVTKGVAVVLDAEKQSEMFHKQAQDEKAEDLKKINAIADPTERYKAGIAFTHKWGHKPA